MKLLYKGTLFVGKKGGKPARPSTKQDNKKPVVSCQFPVLSLFLRRRKRAGRAGVGLWVEGLAPTLSQRTHKGGACLPDAQEKATG